MSSSEDKKAPPDRRWLTETRLTSFAVGIAALALIVSGWTAWQTRKHNRLSVKPLAVFEWRAFDEGREGAFYLSNYGSGPAIVTKYVIEFDGKKFESVWKRDFFETVHERIGIPGNVTPLISNFGAKWAVPAGSEERLYGYMTDQAVPQELRDDLNNRLRFRFYVCSLYEECVWVTP